MKKNVTIHDLAIHSGVSVATVSRVIHQNGYVSKLNEERVLASIRELGYQSQKRTSFSPKSSRNNLIAVLSTPWKEHTFLPRITYALSIAANAAGFHTLSIAKPVCSETLPSVIAEALSNDVCGIVLTDYQGVELTAEEKTLLLNCGVPVVMVERAVCPELNSVKVDTRQGVYMSTKYLLDTGRKNIFYLTAPLSGNVEKERMEGFLLAFSEANLPVDDKNIKICASTRRDACTQAMEEIYHSQNHPDGIITWSDLFSVTALQYLNRKKIKVPDDVSIIGYDDFLASYTTPMLSSVHSPIDEIADAAVSIIRDNLNSKEEFSKRTITLTPKLIIRETC